MLLFFRCPGPSEGLRFGESRRDRWKDREAAETHYLFLAALSSIPPPRFLTSVPKPSVVLHAPSVTATATIAVNTRNRGRDARRVAERPWLVLVIDWNLLERDSSSPRRTQ